MMEEARFAPPTFDAIEEHSEWLAVFCSQNSCEVTSPTQLP
jgi:hypothetical protein